MGPSSSARQRAGPVALLRSVLAVLAIVPGLAAGLAVWPATRDRRRAVNCTCAVWARLGPAAAGIRLAVTGAEHLRLRPAVFLFNHQSAIDPLLVCALLRHDFLGVAKREVRRYPLVGPAFAFAGSVFLDRADPQQALAALGPAVEALRHGLAVAIAPEGTRSPDARIGPFKKGGFRLALAARVPIVPVVIHNARDVLPRGAWLLRPATVRVSVHAPLATTHWTLPGLEDEIAAIRDLYARSLAA